VPLSVTDRLCQVQPYNDEYEPISDVRIITAATGYTSAKGLHYILVFPEVLWMPSLDHSLFNPNQLRHFGTVVQYNPYSQEPMAIEAKNKAFTAYLQSKGTDIFLTTWCPSAADLEAYPHIVLASDTPWNPRGI
jgi:hypothetical protein